MCPQPIVSPYLNMSPADVWRMHVDVSDLGSICPHPDVSQYRYAPVSKYFPVNRIEIKAKSRDLGYDSDTKIEDCLKYRADVTFPFPAT